MYVQPLSTSLQHSCVQRFAPISSAMPIQDQVFLTLMELRQNFAVADLARWFKRSTSHVSKIIEHWIDVLAEHS